MKISVLYHSKSGHTEQMARAIAQGASEAAAIEARAIPIEDKEESSLEFIRESKCVILGSPVYFASICGAVKSWFESDARELGLPGKLCGGFATADYVHGGGELAIQSILNHFMVFGMYAYSGGGAFGKPVIHIGPVALSSSLAEQTPTFVEYGKRMAIATIDLFGPKNSSGGISAA